MSNLVFPSSVSNISAWGWPIKQTPQFNTITQTPASGRGELRIPTMFFPRWDFVLDLSYLKGDATGTNTPWQELINFYIAVQGAAADWLFLHPYDNTILSTAQQTIGTGDAATTEFTMYRSFISTGAQDLIQNFVSAPTIYLNGVAQSGSTYTIDEFGTITFNSAPGAGVTISWSGQFYYRCHFLEDEWNSLEEDLYQIWTMEGLKFRSVLL